ncbi:hypothetical protein [Aurantiacibacter suaedae]|uniref:hypothetical protein n=1 Tax=Aurantiacibacter suaedae TaxID=2545755 RepID=UPI0013A556FF|nr:hypothetical protein [Aurantiacibacter suaedae]
MQPGLNKIATPDIEAATNHPDQRQKRGGNDHKRIARLVVNQTAQKGRSAARLAQGYRHGDLDSEGRFTYPFLSWLGERYQRTASNHVAVVNPLEMKGAAFVKPNHFVKSTRVAMQRSSWLASRRKWRRFTKF